MSITRGALPQDNFTLVSNEWMRDERLSWKARGLLAYLLSHSIGWNVTERNLTEAGTDGRDSVRTGLAELQTAGYLTRFLKRAPDGRVLGTHYVVGAPTDEDHDVADEPLSDNPTLGERTLDNPTTKREKTISQKTIFQETISEMVAPAPSTTKRRNLSPIPDDWAPIASHQEKAEKRGVDITHEAEQFRSWALGKDERKANWDQAFHTWIGNAKSSLRLAHSAPRSTSPDAVTAFLRQMWQEGRAKAVADRSGLRYSQPDVPEEITTGAGAWVKQQARDWIAAHHDEALAAIMSKDAA